MMTAKEYLMQYRSAMRRTQAITEHLSELRAVCEQLRTEDGHRIALDKAVAELVDAEAKTAAEIDRLTELESEIIGTIGRVPEPYATLLYERYINGKTWEQVAVDMHYSYVHVVHNLHPKALKTVRDLIAFNT